MLVFAKLDRFSEKNWTVAIGGTRDLFQWTFETLVVPSLNQTFLGFDPLYPVPFFARKTIQIPVCRNTVNTAVKHWPSPSRPPIILGGPKIRNQLIWGEDPPTSGGKRDFSMFFQRKNLTRWFSPKIGKDETNNKQKKHQRQELPLGASLVAKSSNSVESSMRSASLNWQVFCERTVPC